MSEPKIHFTVVYTATLGVTEVWPEGDEPSKITPEAVYAVVKKEMGISASAVPDGNDVWNWMSDWNMGEGDFNMTLNVQVSDGFFIPTKKQLFEMMLFDESRLQTLAGDPENSVVATALESVQADFRDRGLGELEPSQINEMANLILTNPDIRAKYDAAQQAAEEG